MIDELKIACIKKGITMTDFAASIGRSRHTVYLVANGKATSKPITEAINSFINSDKAIEPLQDLNVSSEQWLTTAEFAKRKRMRAESVANNCKAGRYKRAKFHNKRWLIHISELEG